jgi:hypothetical protein
VTTLNIGLIFLLILLCSARSSFAGPSECQEAISEYKSAGSDVATALKSYSNCISSSDGHDDCSSEFEQLKSAQDDFESAVSNYESECN